VIQDADEDNAVGDRTGELTAACRLPIGFMSKMVSVDQLGALRMGQDAGFGHPVVGANVKPMPGRNLRTIQNGAREFSLSQPERISRPSKRQLFGKLETGA
jgi:hypothetical protein